MFKNDAVKFWRIRFQNILHMMTVSNQQAMYDTALLSSEDRYFYLFFKKKIKTPFFTSIICFII